jgi:lipopolysaccharide heptosyltransferase II
MGWIFYSDRVAVPHDDLHAVDRNYLFGRPLGFSDAPVRFELAISEEARRSATELLGREGASGKRYCLIAPGTRWETKKWPAAGFAEVIRRLRDRFGLEAVLVGMDDERAIADDVAEQAGGPIVNLAGRTSLEELKALVEGAALAVMHDSGPMHLAVAFHTPLIALYGPTSARRTGPYGKGEVVVRLDLPCSPCYLRHVRQCPYDHRCMYELTPDRVMDAAQRVMNESERDG